MDKVINVWTDGGARGNPGPAGIGVVIKDSQNQVIYEFSGYIGHATNNIAEYQAALQALQWIDKHLSSVKDADRPTQINMHLDSQLVVKQLTAEYKIKNNALKNLAVKIGQVTSQLNIPISYTHIPREQNTQADALYNQALDAYHA